MKNSIRGTVLLLALSLLTGVHIANAQASSAGTTTTQTVARMSIESPAMLSIASDAGSSYRVVFNFANKGDVQTGIRYGLNMVRKTAQGQEIVDQAIVPGEISLAQDERRQIQFEYSSPKYLEGKFTPWILAKTSSGITIALAKLPDIEFTAAPGTAEIVPSSCTLHIDGRPASETYTPVQGVDIAATETLSATCDVVSRFAGTASVDASFAAYRRSVFGDPVDLRAAPQQVTLSPGKQKVSIKLPAIAQPQAYDVVLSFAKGGEQVSNRTAFHFVVQGQSGTIQNIALDKTSYQAGDTAHISLVWSGPADGFIGSRAGTVKGEGYTANIQITDASTGGGCSDFFSTKLGRDSIASVAVPITVSCQRPQIAVLLKDSSGKLLDRKEVSVEVPEQNVTKLSNVEAVTYALIAIIAIFGIGILIMFLMKKKTPKNDLFGSVGPLAIAILIGAALWGGTWVDVAHADGETVANHWENTQVWSGEDRIYAVGELTIDTTTYASLDKHYYNPGETLIANVQFDGVMDCGNINSWYGGFDEKITVTIPGDPNPNYVILDATGSNAATKNNYGRSGEYVSTAPTTPGTYEAVFNVTLTIIGSGGEDLNENYTIRIPFEVPPPPPPPPRLSGSCPAPGTVATVAWNAPVGYYEYYSTQASLCDTDINPTCNSLSPGFWWNSNYGSTYFSWTVSGLTPGHNFVAWVFPLGYAGAITESTNFSCTAPPPALPSDFRGECPSPGTTATMRWTPNDLSQHFDVELCDTSINPSCVPGSGYWKTINQSSSPNPEFFWVVDGTTPNDLFRAKLNVNGSSETIEATFTCIPAPVCGTASQTYDSSATDWAGPFCTYGSITGVPPTFPDPSQSRVWYCSNGVENIDCHAIRTAYPATAACGTAAKTYDASASGWGSDTFCTDSSLTGPAPSFPAAGASVNWTCQDLGGTTASCFASHLAPAPPQSFSLTATPALIQGKKTGIPNTYSVSKSSLISASVEAGYIGSITLSAAVPVGSPVLNPKIMTSPGYQSSLYVEIPGTATVGVYPIVVVGVRDDGLAASTTFMIDISSGATGQL